MPADLTKSSVILCLNCKKPGNSKQVDEELVTITEKRNDRELNKNRLRLSKKLYEAPEIDNIAQLMKRVTRYVEDQAMPVDTLKAGMHEIAGEKLMAVVRRLEQFRDAELPPLVAALEAAYPRLIEEAYAEFGSLVEPKDFPAWEEIAQKISITWHCLSYSTPTEILSRINLDLAREEERKMEAHVAFVCEQLETALAVGLAQVIETMAEKLKPGKDGRPRKVSDAAVSRWNELIATIQTNNTTGNTKLADLARQTEALLNGATPEELSQNRGVRAAVLQGMERLAQEMSDLTVTKTGRKIVVRKPQSVPADGVPSEQEVSDAA